MDSILSKYQIEKEHHDISGLSVQLVRVINLDELYNELIQKGDNHEDVKDERIPYWADLWHSAIALSQHIVKSNVINEKNQTG